MVGLPTERDATYLISTGEPERSGDFVQRQPVCEHVVVDEHAFRGRLWPGDPQGVAQRAFGDVRAALGIRSPPSVVSGRSSR